MCNIKKYIKFFLYVNGNLRLQIFKVESSFPSLKDKSFKGSLCLDMLKNALSSVFLMFRRL